MKTDECILPPELMDGLARKIEAGMGLSFQAARRRDLERALRRMAAAERFEDVRGCAEWLLAGLWNERKIALCARHLTIGETYFFRERRAFDLLCEYAGRKMADPARAGQRLRVWSAGCCTGEEAYSIAIALRRALPEAERSRVSILATDIHPGNIRFARAGVYRQWSFRTADAQLQGAYFSPHDEGRLRISNEIREMVRFDQLNLAMPLYPSAASGTEAQDIIFCRNVLIYFSREQAKKVIARFRDCLVDGGWLVVSPSEASSELFSGFTGHYYPDAIYFQKNAQADPHEGITRDASFVIAPDMLPERTCERPAARNPYDILSVPRSRRPVRASAQADVSFDGAQPEDATHLIMQAPAELPVAAEAHYAKALAAIEAGRPDDALQCLKRVLYLQPDFILAYYQLGVLHIALNRGADAYRRFNAANELLDALDDDEIVPCSDGLHAAYLRESIRAYLRKEIT